MFRLAASGLGEAPTFGVRVSARARRLAASVLKLGSGEIAARLSSFLLFAYVSRAYGVELLGTVALAQTVATYVTLGTDQGLCLLGARTVAKNPFSAVRLLKPVIAKRLMLCALSVSIGTAYALCGPIPESARFYVLGFVLAVIPYALSLDWIAWGLDRMGWLGTSQSIVSGVFVVGAIWGMHWTHSTLLPLAISRVCSTAAGAMFLWVGWHRWRRGLGTHLENGADSRPQFAWGTIFALGGATISNFLFGSADTLILAGMTTASEVGRYNAAYKIMFAIFSGYYLITRSLYPHFSATDNPEGLRRKILQALPVVAMAGASLSGLLWLFGGQLLTLIYGSTLGAVPLLRILTLALPIELCTALVGVLWVTQGRDRLNLLATSSAAALNIALNLVLIPRMRALGAAWATVLAYGFLLGIVLYSLRPGQFDAAM